MNKCGTYCILSLKNMIPWGSRVCDTTNSLCVQLNNIYHDFQSPYETREDGYQACSCERLTNIQYGRELALHHLDLKLEFHVPLILNSFLCSNDVITKGCLKWLCSKIKASHEPVELNLQVAISVIKIMKSMVMLLSIFDLASCLCITRSKNLVPFISLSIA